MEEHRFRGLEAVDLSSLGLTALLIEIPTALPHSTRVIFLQQMRAQQVRENWEIPLYSALVRLPLE